VSACRCGSEAPRALTGRARVLRFRPPPNSTDDRNDDERARTGDAGAGLAVRGGAETARAVRGRAAGQGLRAVRDRLRALRPAAYRDLRRGGADDHGAAGLPAPVRPADPPVRLLRRYGRVAPG